jgi:hypothetical protein
VRDNPLLLLLLLRSGASAHGNAQDKARMLVASVETL